VRWKIYYGDGAEYGGAGNNDASTAPTLNVQAIAQEADIAIGRKTVSRYDFYWYCNDEWFGGDLFGLFDYLVQPGYKVVKFGRAINRLEFEKILNRAVTDTDLIPKVAWESCEKRGV